MRHQPRVEICWVNLRLNRTEDSECKAQKIFNFAAASRLSVASSRGHVYLGEILRDVEEAECFLHRNRPSTSGRELVSKHLTNPLVPGRKTTAISVRAYKRLSNIKKIPVQRRANLFTVYPHMWKCTTRRARTEDENGLSRS